MGSTGQIWMQSPHHGTINDGNMDTYFTPTTKKLTVDGKTFS